MLNLRHQRKGLLKAELAEAEISVARVLHSLWQPRDLNWWIGSVFSLGASLFLLGSILSLRPELAVGLSLDSLAVNMIFFAGSIPFTTAAYLQLYQSANAPALAANTQQPLTRAWFGWRPGNLGWLSAAPQFIGTLLFNLNTWDALQPSANWLQQDLAIWVPDLFGSILFLASGYFAIVECCRGRSWWQPASVSWWITVINFLGCIAFMVSAMLSFVPAAGVVSEISHISLIFTGIGAACFLIGSLLMLPEAAS